jgi:hypothetical protein
MPLSDKKDTRSGDARIGYGILSAATLLLLFTSRLFAQSPFFVPHEGLGADSAGHKQVLFDGQVVVPPGKRHVVTFTSRSNLRNARIAGNVQASGGTGNDIRVLVAKGQSLAYDSGRRRSVVLSVDFSEPGQYALIFDNSFSVLSPKTVTGRIVLVSWGVDAARNDEVRAQDAFTFNLATTIVRRLFSTLKADERVMGTSQMTVAPTIRIVHDKSVNAAADWATNIMFVNTGLFEFASRAGEKQSDILAGVMAHELGHIFYRHPGYGGATNGMKGLLEEFIGANALDRAQEKEADILGIRVACQAGYDPEGLIIFMEYTTSLDTTPTSYMKNHPAAIERVQYLRPEAASCVRRQPIPNAPTTTTSDFIPRPVASQALQTSDFVQVQAHPTVDKGTQAVEILTTVRRAGIMFSRESIKAHAVITVTFAFLNDQGQEWKVKSDRVEMSLDAAQFQRVEQHGLVYHTTIPANAGATRLRVTVRDQDGDEIGTADVSSDSFDSANVALKEPTR